MAAGITDISSRPRMVMSGITVERMSGVYVSYLLILGRVMAEAYYEDRHDLLILCGQKGGSAPKHKWVDWERDIVRRDYAGTNASAKRIADRLGVTLYAVKGQVQKMGLAKRKLIPWTDKEEEMLAELITQYAPITIAKRMGRSVNAIVVKSKKRGYSRRARDGWYTKREVAEILGVDHKKIQYFVDIGALKGQAHFPGDIPQKCGQHPWHFKRQDLGDFIRKHAIEFNGRNVDLFQIVDILGIK